VKILGIAILVALALLALFSALNWSALTAPTALSFVFFTVEGPLGVILLGAALAFALVLLAYAAMQRTSMLMESRRQAQELKAQRDLAEQAEASRLHELRQQLERECADLRSRIDEAANSLAAGIGQIDDKLSRPGTLIAGPRDGQS
jgi:uncharacterized integral membrane protein